MTAINTYMGRAAWDARVNAELADCPNFIHLDPDYISYLFACDWSPARAVEELVIVMGYAPTDYDHEAAQAERRFGC